MMDSTMMSETVGELAKALTVAQSQLEGARKDGENPHFRSRYADLTSCWAACREPLAANGLSVVQLFDGMDEEGRMVLISTLLHESGEWIASRLAMPMEKITPQGLVAASTYARRAALCALVGISPADDDGETAEGRGNSSGRMQSNSKGSAGSRVHKQIKNILQDGSEITVTEAEKMKPVKKKSGSTKAGLVKSLGASLRNRGWALDDLVKLAGIMEIDYKGGPPDALNKADLESLLEAVTKTKDVEEIRGLDTDSVPF